MEYVKTKTPFFMVWGLGWPLHFPWQTGEPGPKKLPLFLSWEADSKCLSGFSPSKSWYLMWNCSLLSWDWNHCLTELVNESKRDCVINKERKKTKPQAALLLFSKRRTYLWSHRDLMCACAVTFMLRTPCWLPAKPSTLACSCESSVHSPVGVAGSTFMFSVSCL